MTNGSKRSRRMRILKSWNDIDPQWYCQEHFKVGESRTRHETVVQSEKARFRCPHFQTEARSRGGKGLDQLRSSERWGQYHVSPRGRKVQD